MRGGWSSHGSHRDFASALITFDFNKWYGTGQSDVPSPKDQWWAHLSAHEWGHAMSLADHLNSSNCGEGTLMIDYFGGLPSSWPNPCRTGPTTTDIGSVRCKVYGCHPNGTLVQAPSGGVYVLHANYRRHVPSPPVLNSWYDPSGSEIVPITESELGAYTDCCKWGYRPGKLVQDPSTLRVYFITNDGPVAGVSEYALGTKVWIQHQYVLQDCFPGKPIIWDTYGSLQFHAEGASMFVMCSQNGPKHPNGTVVQDPSGAVYVLEVGKKRHVISPAALNSWFFQPDIVQISASESVSYTTGAKVAFRPGRLIQNQSLEIFFVTNEGDFPKAIKRYIWDPVTLNCLFPGESWIPVTNADANWHTTGAPLQISGC